MADQKIMKDISLNEPITVTVPAWMWLHLTAAYNDCEWSNSHLSDILMRAQRQILDPIYLRETEAAAQHEHDKQHEMFTRFTQHLTGGTIEGPEGDSI